MARDGDRPRLCWMMVLSVAAFGSRESPAIVFQLPN